MKNYKRSLAIITAAFLAATPLAATGLTAFAANHSLTVVDTDPIAHKYYAYQIITGTLENGALSGMNWGDGVDPAKLITALNDNKTALGIENDIAANATVNDVAAVLAKITDADKVQKLAKTFNAAGVLVEDAKKELTKDGDNYTNTSLADGWYLICDESSPLGTGDDSNVKVKSANLLQIVGDTEIDTKHSLPTLDKVIVEGSDEVDANEASIGDVVTYRIKTKVPDMTGYDTYFFIVNDTLSKGLTYNEDLTVKVGTDSLTEDEDGALTAKNGDFYVDASEYNSTSGTDIKVVFKSVVDLFKTYEVGTDIVLEYTATLNENAEITNSGNPNTASLTYSNNPNEEANGTPGDDDNPPKPDEPGPEDNDVIGETPEDFVKTYTTAIKIKKVDNHGTKLTGAMFRITGDGVNTVVVAGDIFVEDSTGGYYKLTNGTYTDVAPDGTNDSKYASTTTKYKKINKQTIEKGTSTSVNVEAFVDENGYVTFTGLGNGNYTIEEIIVPEGFKKADNVAVAITSNPNLEKANWTVKKGETALTLDETDNTYGVEIVNVQFSNLPTTGGIGTKLFYLFGGILVAGSGILLITKKRMAKDN